MDGKEMIQEGANINRSLLALTNCINILSDANQSKKPNPNIFIPFRNSKLTRILKESLDGSQPVIMIVCLSPNGIFVEETLNSIKYAEKAKNIKRCDDEIRSRIWSKVKSGKEEDYLKRIEDLERENGWLRNMIRSKTMESVQSLKMEGRFCESCLNLKDKSIVEPAKGDTQLARLEGMFSDMYAANEEISRLKMNIQELDQIIKFNDSEIGDIQSSIDDLERKVGELTPRGQFNLDHQLAFLYEDLTSIADKLEDNLDLKEDMISEMNHLDSRSQKAKDLILELFRKKTETIENLSAKISMFEKEISKPKIGKINKKENILYESVSAKTVVKRVEPGSEVENGIQGICTLKTSRYIGNKKMGRSEINSNENMTNLLEKLKENFKPSEREQRDTIIKIPKLDFEVSSRVKDDQSRALKTLNYCNSDKYLEAAEISSVPLPIPKSIHPSLLRKKVINIRDSLNSKVEKSLTNPMSLMSSERPGNSDYSSSNRDRNFSKKES